jgi:hypothetical protein
MSPILRLRIRRSGENKRSSAIVPQQSSQSSRLKADQTGLRETTCVLQGLLGPDACSGLPFFIFKMSRLLLKRTVELSNREMTVSNHSHYLSASRRRSSAFKRSDCRMHTVSSIVLALNTIPINVYPLSGGSILAPLPLFRSDELGSHVESEFVTWAYGSLTIPSVGPRYTFTRLRSRLDSQGKLQEMFPSETAKGRYLDVK